jgi:hypothetical protein
MASYIDTADFTSISVPYKRSTATPIDKSSMFSTYEDAVEYAKGKYKKEGENRATAHDSRKLAGTSYIGQIITVYENDVVTVYKIDFDRTIKVLGGGSVDCGEYI